MRRRGFFKSLGSAVAGWFSLRRARAQEIRPEQIHELAAAVLPASLGRERIRQVAANFVAWIRDYKAGAQISSGYGHPHTQVTGPNPSARYAEQLRALGSPITRDSVAQALEAERIERIPPQPNGRHVATDLLAFFYGSAAGEDFLYGVAIRRDDCRGLENSAKKPARLG